MYQYFRGTYSLCRDMSCRLEVVGATVPLSDTEHKSVAEACDDTTGDRSHPVYPV